MPDDTTSNDSPITWKAATVDDVEQIQELWERCGLGYDADTDKAEMVTRLTDHQDLFVMGLRNDRLVASAMACWDGHRAHIKRVSVDPAEQGNGVGQLMMAETERRLIEQGMTELRLAVWTDNTKAIRFWESQGWEELADIRYFTKSVGD